MHKGILIKDNSRNRRRLRRGGYKYKDRMMEVIQEQCFYCERTLNIRAEDPSDNPWLDPTKDHIIPKSKGGLTSPANMKRCCHQCNKLKADHTPEEFLAVLKVKASKDRFGMYRRDIFMNIIKNTERLVREIQPIRDTLVKDGWKDQPKIEEVKERLKMRPSSKQQLKSQQEWLDRFQKKHPLIYTQMMAGDKGLPVWIYENLVLNKIDI